jgi:hypothetical protein
MTADQALLDQFEEVRKELGDLKRRFEPIDLGELLATPLVTERVDPMRVIRCLARHQVGDFGILPPEDVEENLAQYKHGGRVMSSWAIDPEQSAHWSSSANVFWLITDEVGIVTTALLPEEY